MSSKVDICNMALAHCRAGSINSLNEGSNEAEQCELFYDIARKTVLEAAPWYFTRKVDALALLVEEPTEWAYSYAYPTDCLKISRLIPNVFVTSGNSNAITYRLEYYDMNYDYFKHIKVEYECGLNDDGSQAIWTNEPDAHIVYTVNQENTNRFPSSFITCLSHYLATMIAKPVMGLKEGRQVMEDHYNIYQQTLSIAIRNGDIQQYKGPPRESEMITVRR